MKKFLITTSKGIAWVALLLLVAFMAACDGGEEELAATAVPEVAEQPTETPLPPTDTPAPTDTPVPTDTPTPADAATPETAPTVTAEVEETEQPVKEVTITEFATNYGVFSLQEGILYQTTGEEWNPVSFSPEAQQAITENGGIASLETGSLKDGNTFLQVFNEAGNQILAFDRRTNEFIKTFWSNWYGEGDLTLVSPSDENWSRELPEGLTLQPIQFGTPSPMGEWAIDQMNVDNLYPVSASVNHYKLIDAEGTVHRATEAILTSLVDQGNGPETLTIALRYGVVINSPDLTSSAQPDPVAFLRYLEDYFPETADQPLTIFFNWQDRPGSDFKNFENWRNTGFGTTNGDYLMGLVPVYAAETDSTIGSGEELQALLNSGILVGNYHDPVYVAGRFQFPAEPDSN